MMSVRRQNIQSDTMQIKTDSSIHESSETQGTPPVSTGVLRKINSIQSEVRTVMGGLFKRRNHKSKIEDRKSKVWNLAFVTVFAVLGLMGRALPIRSRDWLPAISLLNGIRFQVQQATGMQ
jgi:hypothetical protein